ncbi:thioredoxin 1 [Catalinimonas alkaloidigena]|uniref:thioredoxin family protein n=1 Tax=Catalinimonas alkaloidigena TaxID=1075417 RepID=UPI002404A592|nr:thioredoxin family protein [Catalinimonas alkaloidigena]MDF9795945.1 thioredoxin 1 [Catalinimonas alkaloidigena]
MAVELIEDSEFQEKLKQQNKVIVKYYADWCGSCRLFKPKYRRLSEDQRFDDVTFLDVNAEKNPEARKAAGVTNLPFFAVFKNGELLDSVASSKEEAVVELIEKLN